MGDSNKEGSNRATMQCDKILKCLKVTYGHTTRNMLKRWQNFIDHTHVSSTPYPIPSSSSLFDLDGLHIVTITSNP
jgi:hypothetical protein